MYIPGVAVFVRALYGYMSARAGNIEWRALIGGGPQYMVYGKVYSGSEQIWEAVKGGVC